MATSKVQIVLRLAAIAALRETKNSNAARTHVVLGLLPDRTGGFMIDVNAATKRSLHSIVNFLESAEPAKSPAAFHFASVLSRLANPHPVRSGILPYEYLFNRDRSMVCGSFQAFRNAFFSHWNWMCFLCLRRLLRHPPFFRRKYAPPACIRPPSSGGPPTYFQSNLLSLSSNKLYYPSLS
jgi:hypothetical protein